MSILPHPDRPRLTGAPSVAELASVECPVDRARQVSSLARRIGTLPPPLAAVRRQALVEARAAGHAVVLLAARVGLTPGRVSQLTRTVTS